MKKMICMLPAAVLLAVPAVSLVFESYNISPGIWNIMATFKGDHAAIIGGLTKKVDVTAFYINQMRMIESLAG